MRFYHFSDLNLMNLLPVFSNLKDKKIEFQDNCYCIIYMAVVSREETREVFRSEILSGE